MIEDDAQAVVMEIANAPANPFNEHLQPVPLASKKGLVESNQGPAAALTIMHPAGEFTMMTQNPDDLANLAQELLELASELKTAQLRHMLTNPSGLVVPTPNIPDANGAKLL